MVVHEEERNIYDQKAFIAASRVSPFCVRLSPSLTHVSIGETLAIDGYEISIVYWRTGYAPAHYQTCNDAWGIRARIEQSRAIKCPSINLQLTGMKKVQELLALNPAMLADLNVSEDLRVSLQSFTTQQV